MGFDEWFKKKFKDLHEAICCGDLVANNYKKAIKKGFKAGAASRQSEIDNLKAELETLQGMHNAVSLEAGNLVEDRDELQKRINKACEIMEDSRDNKKLIAMSDIHEILRCAVFNEKGPKNDNPNS